MCNDSSKEKDELSYWKTLDLNYVIHELFSQMINPCAQIKYEGQVFRKAQAF